jgi:hypothetical protein
LFTGSPPIPNPSGKPIKALVTFVNSDPSRPICVAIHGGTLEHLVTTEALAVILFNLVIGLGAGTLPSAWLVSGVAVGLVNAALAASSIPAPSGLLAQVAAAATQAAAMISASPGATSLPFAASLAAMETKVDNVSGLFPGIGCAST